MNINQLRMMAVFAKVAETASFKQAAEQLAMVPSVVSKQISDLEAQLGTQLLHRSTRSVRLSEQGQIFLKACNKMLQAAEQGFADLSQQRTQPSGHLRLTIPSVLSSDTFAAFVMRFQQSYPEVLLDIDCSDDKKDLIRDHFDLALHIGELPNSQLFGQLLFRTHGIICTHTKYQNLIDAIQHPHDLYQWYGLLLPNLAKGFTLTQHHSGVTLAIKPPKTTRINTGSLIQNSLKYAPVWSIFPDFAIQKLIKQGTLYRLLPDWYVVADALYAISTAQLTRLPLAHLFVTALRKELKTLF